MARVGECCRCECAGCGQYGWVQMDCPPQWLLTSLVVLGTDYDRIWELHLALRCVICSMVFARALSVVADRCDSKTP